MKTADEVLAAALEADPEFAVGLQQDLEDLLGADVDVLSDGDVSPHLRERIYAEAILL